MVPGPRLCPRRILHGSLRFVGGLWNTVKLMPWLQWLSIKGKGEWRTFFEMTQWPLVWKDLMQKLEWKIRTWIGQLNPNSFLKIVLFIKVTYKYERTRMFLKICLWETPASTLLLLFHLLTGNHFQSFCLVVLIFIFTCINNNTRVATSWIFSFRDCFLTSHSGR